jgi:hypothetical protein
MFIPLLYDQNSIFVKSGFATTFSIRALNFRLGYRFFFILTVYDIVTLFNLLAPEFYI